MPWRFSRPRCPRLGASVVSESIHQMSLFRYNPFVNYSYFFMSREYIPDRLIETQVAEKYAQYRSGEHYLSGLYRMEWLDAADKAGTGCLRLVLHLLWLVKVRQSAEVIVNQTEVAEKLGWSRKKVGGAFSKLEAAGLVDADHQQGRFLRVRLKGNPQIVPSRKKPTNNNDIHVDGSCE